MILILLAGLGIVAGVIGGVAGFGSALLLLPVCTFAFGPSQTVPVLTIASLMGNLSRVAFSWNETDWRVVATYLLGAVPAAIAGAFVFVSTGGGTMQRLLGLFILASIPARRWFMHHGLLMKRWQFAPLGAVMGFLSAIAGTTGPINAPFFLAYGLVKGAFLATESLGAAAIHLIKSGVYGRFALLDAHTLAIGAGLGAMLALGAWIGRRIIDRIDARAFVRVVELLLAVSGLAMVARV